MLVRSGASFHLPALSETDPAPCVDDHDRGGRTLHELSPPSPGIVAPALTLLSPRRARGNHSQYSQAAAALTAAKPQPSRPAIAEMKMLMEGLLRRKEVSTGGRSGNGAAGRDKGGSSKAPVHHGSARNRSRPGKKAGTFGEEAPTATATATSSSPRRAGVGVGCLTAVSARVKNPTRAAPPPFTGRLHFVECQARDGTIRYGHLLADASATGTAMVLFEMEGVPTPVPRDTTIRTLVGADSSSFAIPRTAYMEVTSKRQSKSKEAPETDFLDFTVGTNGTANALAVRPLSCAVFSDTRSLVDAIRAFLVRDGLDNHCVVSEPSSLSSRTDQQKYTPWNEFWMGVVKGDDGSYGIPFALVRVTISVDMPLSRVASRLIGSGLVVAVATASPSPSPSASPSHHHHHHHPDTCAPFIRVKSSPLKWIKDEERVAELSKIVDQLPSYGADAISGANGSAGTSGGTAGMGASSGGPSSSSRMPWAGVVYGQELHVQRTMLDWGMLAAMVTHNAPGLAEDDIARMSEPLRSYVRLVHAFEEYREGVTTGIDASVLHFNTAGKLTPAQTSQANELFYWAAIHDDDATRPVSRSIALRALEMYLSFGHTVLRKRAYEFCEKRPRATAIARVPGWLK